MNLTPEEIKKWNDAVSSLTAICNHHCTDTGACKDCPFDELRFGEYPEDRDYCPISAGVLYTGTFGLSVSDFLRNQKEKQLRTCEKQVIIKHCITCYWRNKETNFCPELGFRILAPESRMCDCWRPRRDLFDKEKS